MTEGKWHPGTDKLAKSGALYSVIDLMYKSTYLEQEHLDKIYSDTASLDGANDYFVIFALGLLNASQDIEKLSHKVKLK